MGKVIRKEQGEMGRRIRTERREADAGNFIQTEKEYELNILL